MYFIVGAGVRDFKGKQLVLAKGSRMISSDFKGSHWIGQINLIEMDKIMKGVR